MKFAKPAPLPLPWAIGLLVLLLALPAFGLAQDASRPKPGTPPTVLVMGDSLSAGYGLSAEQGWVALLEDRIASVKPAWRVVNASISGETTSGGSARIVREVLRVRPAVVVIELGANDGLRGLPLREMRHNLARMIGASQYVGAKVLLVGMRIPPNYGADYANGFDQVYRDLAAHFDVSLLPFLLDPIAADRGNFQDDNLHPVAGAQPALRDHVWKSLSPLLQKPQ
jgi:acyl-CoA thioesterase I